MSPRFRGGSDDWLDDEASSSRARGPKGKKSTGTAGRSAGIPDEEANGTVAEVFPKQCRVALDDGSDVQCFYRRSKLLSGRLQRERSPVAVGDRVKVSVQGGEGAIEGLCARRSQLVRRAPAREQVLHVLAANAEAVVIVASARNPDFSPGLVDRFLIAAKSENVEPIVCINKIDLADPGADRPWERIYRASGDKVFEVSAKRNGGVAALREAIVGRKAVFCGHSGVGKTSLISALLGESAGRTGSVSDATGKGRHTTTSAILLGGPEGSSWIDTPGIREFGLTHVAPEELRAFYPELVAAPCATPGCLHHDEPGCAATGLPRYVSYRRILDSLIAGEH